jgi:hypothetical protein
VYNLEGLGHHDKFLSLEADLPILSSSLTENEVKLELMRVSCMQCIVVCIYYKKNVLF